MRFTILRLGESKKTEVYDSIGMSVITLGSQRSCALDIATCVRWMTMMPLTSTQEGGRHSADDGMYS